MEYLTLNSFSTKRSVTIDSLKTHFLPIQEGEGDPSPDNVRPITGWNSIKIRKTGKNLAKIVGYSATSPNSVSSVRRISNSYGTTLSTTDYSDELTITQTQYPDASNLKLYTNGYFCIVLDGLPYDKQYNVSFKVSNVVSNPLNATLSDITIANPYGTYTSIYNIAEDGRLIYKNMNYKRHSANPNRCSISIYNCGMSFTLSEFMITAVEDEDFTYEPYREEEVEVELPETIYGGYVDIAKGELVQEWEVASIVWGEAKRGDPDSTTGYYYAIVKFSNLIQTIHNKSTYGSITLCNAVGLVSWNNGSITPEHYYGGNGNNIGSCYVFGDFDDDLEIQIAAKLLTPIHYPLPPETLKTLRGFNTIFSTTNDTIEVGYSEMSPTSLLKRRRDIIASEPHLVTVETGNTEDSDIIASFKTNAALPIKSMVTNFEPKQDLNGYSSPFPEGGGSNILEVSSDKHFTSNPTSYNGWTESDNIITITSNCQGGYLVSCEPNTTYTYSFKYYDANSLTRFHARVWEGTEDPITSISNSMLTINTTLYSEPNAVFTFTTNPDTICLIVGFYIYNVESPITVTEMQLEKGSTATKYNAYGSSNICPIEGMDELEIHNFPHLVQWNQWLQPLTEENWNPYDANNISVAFSDGVAISEWLIDSGGYRTAIRNKALIPNPEGHIWYVSYMVKHHAQDIKRFGVEFAGGRQVRSIVAAEPDVWYQVSTVGSYYKGNNAFVYISNESNNEGEIGLIVETKSPVYVDLTQMFGAGNEPTKDEFEAQCALNGIDLTTYNPYDEGTVMPWRTSENEDQVYNIPLTLPNLITPEPKSITSYNVDFTVNEDGTVDYEGTPTSYASVRIGTYYVKGGETITVTLCGDIANLCFNAQALYDSSNNRISFLGNVNNYEGKITYTIDFSEYPDAYRLTIQLKRLFNDVDMKGKCWVRVVEGTVDTGDEVFGGYIDLENNELVVTYGQRKIFGNENWIISSAISGYCAYRPTIANFAPASSTYVKPICNKLKSVAQWATKLYEATINSSGNFYFGAPEELSTKEATNEWVKEIGGIDVVYPLANPVHFPLSPTVIRTLKGTNNIYTNANGKSIIKYWTH